MQLNFCEIRYWFTVFCGTILQTNSMLSSSLPCMAFCIGKIFPGFQCIFQAYFLSFYSVSRTCSFLLLKTLGEMRSPLFRVKSNCSWVFPMAQCSNDCNGMEPTVTDMVLMLVVHVLQHDEVHHGHNDVSQALFCRFR